MSSNDDAGLGRFLSLADVAELLNISPRQSYALVRSGELPGIQLGGNGAWRVEQEVLDGYIAAKYEESRRMAAWRQQAEWEVPDLFAPRSQ